MTSADGSPRRSRGRRTPTPPPPMEPERRSLAEFSEKAYLEYSMYVVLDRALPRIGDGLKPVQRRILYAMSELGLSATHKPKKAARTVGDVIGKFHPHGDSACYEAMVLMAQPFSYRYPLIEGQGNFGSTDDPKSFAAMRYTEARLSKFSQLLLSELGEGTVDWQPNFDGTLSEPRLLPARLPHVLLNGTMGIAVGMATDIPPHNVREMAAACVRLLEEPDASIAQLCEHVPGPDFPTEAEIITPRAELLALYETGMGSVRTRARYEVEDGLIVITALPYQVSGARLMEQIAQQMRDKKLPMVEDLRDESDHENPVRIVITPRSGRASAGVESDELMAHLFATTDLERSHRVNLNLIGLDGRPRVFDLKSLLSDWLRFRTETVRRRLQHHLDRVSQRLHILDGLLIVFLNLDEVIRIVRREDEPKGVLMQRFTLTDLQADAILDTRLRHLARLEEMKIREEQQKLAAERDDLTTILSSAARLKRRVRDEIIRDAKEFGDARRSPLVERAAARALDVTEIVPAELVTVVLSEKGFVRAAKGHEIDAAALSYRAGDALRQAARGRSNQQAVFLDSTGRAYALPAHKLPSARGLGEPLSASFNPPPGASFVAVAIGSPEDEILVATDAGNAFVTKLSELTTSKRAGKSLLTVPEAALVLPACPVVDADMRVAVATTSGRLLLCALAEVPRLARGRGDRLIAIPGKKAAAREEVVAGLVLLPAGASLAVTVGKRVLTLKPADLKPYTGEVGARGEKLPRGFQQVTGLSAVTS